MLQELMLEVSDPKSINYGKYMTLDAMKDIYKPAKNVVDGFQKFLTLINARDIQWTVGQDFVQFSISARDVRLNLGLPVFVYKHVASGRSIIRSDLRLNDLDETSRNHRGLALLAKLPKELQGHLELTLGLFDIFDSKQERRDASAFLRHNHDLLNKTNNNNKPVSGPLKPEGAVAASTGNSTNQPIISIIVGGTSDLNIYFQPVCQNGQLPSNPSSLCGEFGVPITRFSVIVKPYTYDPIELIVDAKNARCAVVNEAPNPPPNDNGTLADSPRVSAKDHVILRATRKMLHRFMGQENMAVAPTINCIITAKLAYPLLRANVSVQSVYSSEDKSGRFYYPTAYAPTEYILPQTIFDLYGVPASYRSTHPANSQAIVSFEQQYINTDDLHTFQDLMGQRRSDCNIIGPNDPAYPGGESTLDVQYVMGVGVGVNTTCWSFPVGDYVLNWAIAVGNTAVAPLVTSISYGDTEIGYEQKSGYGLQYIYRMNSELIKMADRGLTVIAGSGDAGWSNVGEMGNDLSAPDPTCSPMRAFYPSVSPYVTSLSSTFVGLNALPVCSSIISPNPDDHVSSVNVVCNRAREIAVSVTDGMGWTTGGGFSNVTLRHKYQESAVSEYLATAKNLPPTPLWNSSGQGYADIATVGWNQLVVWFGELFPIGGTSASGPVAAGLVALLNDVRLRHNKPPLGFINPLFYQLSATHPEAFNDVTVGSNNDGDIQPPGSPYPTFCPYGFSCNPGWDPVTGLGSPNWQVLSKLIL
eukprot:TRINITY_DN235_c0_g1_i1.p1 TRINITY_DN235_c0_g1~~TRINITY_DN235_c0_g1_i1.p1  ORF type:complete len:811 (-),score=412.50 TRINITY_DN235_c0_g1_i1:70-2334(-)